MTVCSNSLSTRLSGSYISNSNISFCVARQGVNLTVAQPTAGHFDSSSLSSSPRLNLVRSPIRLNSICDSDFAYDSLTRQANRFRRAATPSKHTGPSSSANRTSRRSTAPFDPKFSYFPPPSAIIPTRVCQVPFNGTAISTVFTTTQAESLRFPAVKGVSL